LAQLGGPRWRRCVRANGREIKAYLDTGTTGWSVLSARAARELELQVEQLREPVALSSPLGGPPREVREWAALEVAVGDSGVVLEVLVTELEGEVDLYVAEEDMEVLGFNVAVNEIRPKGGFVAALVEGKGDEAVDPKDASLLRIKFEGTTRSELASGKPGPFFGTKFNEGNTKDYHYWRSRVLEEFERNQSRTRFMSKMDPVTLALEPGTTREKLPWAGQWVSRDKTKEELLNKHIDKMLERGCWEEYTGERAARPWGKDGRTSRSQMFIANGRAVGNFVALNQHIKADESTADLPDLLARIVQKMATGSVFSKVDLRSAYDQIPIEGVDIFAGANGRTFRYRCLPQGLAVAPFVFNGIVQALIRKLEDRLAADGRRAEKEAVTRSVVAYFDDVFVGGEVKRSEDGLYDIGEHAQAVINVLEMLNADDGFLINVEKSVIFAAEVDVGGWRVSSGKIKMTGEKRQMLEALKVPKTAAQLRESLGFLVFLQGLAKGVGVALAPCHKFTSGKGALTPAAVQIISGAFEEAKRLLMAADGMSPPDFTVPFVLTTDASRGGIGYVLANVHPDGSRTTVAHGSRGLSNAERHYSASQLEMLGIVYAVRQCEYYLGGRRFDLETDHKALVGALGAERPKDLTLRWWTFLQQFTFRIIHIAGATNGVADALSRVPREEDASEWRDEIERAYRAVPEDVVIRGMRRVGRQSAMMAAMGSKGRTATGADAEELSEEEEQTEKREPARRRGRVVAEVVQPCGLMEDPGDLDMTRPMSYSSRREPIPPRDDWGRGRRRWHPSHPLVNVAEPRDRRWILEQAHSLGHPGAPAMVGHVRYWGWSWKGLWGEAKDFVEKCTQCQVYRVAHKGVHMTDEATYDEAYPGRHIVMDKTEMPLSREGYKYILVLVDVASRRVWARALRTGTAVEVARNVLDIFLNDGFPMIVSSDNGTEFVNEVTAKMKELCKLNWKTISPWHPQGNGVAERSVGKIIQKLRRMCDAEHTLWAEVLQAVVFSINVTRSETTGAIPFEVYFARPVRALTDFTEAGDLAAASTEGVERARMEDAVRLLDIVIPGLAERQQQYAEKRAKRTQETKRIVEFKVGQKVWVEDERKHVGRMERRRNGPFTIVEKHKGSYAIVDAEGQRLATRVATDRLVPFKGGEKADEDESSDAIGVEDDGKVYVVKEVIDDEEREDGRWYLTRWKGYEEPTWNHVSHFNEVGAINKYLAKKARSGKPDLKRGRGAAKGDVTSGSKSRAKRS